MSEQTDALWALARMGIVVPGTRMRTPSGHVFLITGQSRPGVFRLRWEVAAFEVGRTPELEYPVASLLTSDAYEFLEPEPGLLTPAHMSEHG